MQKDDIFILIFQMYSLEQRRRGNTEEGDVTVINLIGDMRQNIEELLCRINCKCGMANHLRSIFAIYCDKIHKLRSQRDYYKNLLDQVHSHSKSHIIPNQGNLSQASTDQICGHHGEEPNIFEMLQKEFVPVSVKLKMPQNDKSSISYLLHENVNPEDSLLISQSGSQKHNQSHDESCKENREIAGKSFQQFLQDRAERNQMKLKLAQDLISLSSKRNRPGSNALRPLGNRNY